MVLARRLGIWAVVVVALSFALSIGGQRTAFAQDAFRGNAGFDSASLAGNDDSSTGLVNIGFTVNFYGLTFNQLYVNNNGNVTFDQALSTYTPFSLTSTGRQIIAPFFGDVDTRAGNLTRYGSDTVDGRPAFAVNWRDVGYFSVHTDKLNTFQLVMVDRSDIAPGDFDFEFNYNRIQWETGDASSGVNGLGGFPARAGFSNGTGAAGSFFELAGSAVSGALIDGGPNALISSSLNSPVLGRYLFQVRGGQVTVGSGPLPPVVERPCGAGPMSGSVVGDLPFRQQAYYAPGQLAPGVFLNPGTYWVIGLDESEEFYQVLLSCQYLWVPVGVMQPNFDRVWQGRPLPTLIIGATSGK